MKLEFVGGPLDGKNEELNEKEYALYLLTNSVTEQGHRYKFYKVVKEPNEKVLFIYNTPEVKV